MKKLAIILLIVVAFVPLAMAQDTTAQQLQNVNIRIIQLSAQRDLNNQMILDFTRRALTIDQQIQELGQQRQQLTAKSKEGTDAKMPK